MATRILSTEFHVMVKVLEDSLSVMAEEGVFTFKKDVRRHCLEGVVKYANEALEKRREVARKYRKRPKKQ